MKQSSLNPLERELRQSAPEGPHPDADQLTAFAEGSLLAREQKQVLAHLASCGECREVVALACAAAPEPEPALAPKHALRRIWGMGLWSWAGWVGAASLIVLTSVPGLMHWHKAPQEKQTAALDQLASVPATVRATPPAPSTAKSSPAPTVRTVPVRPPAGKEAAPAPAAFIPPPELTENPAAPAGNAAKANGPSAPGLSNSSPRLEAPTPSPTAGPVARGAVARNGAMARAGAAPRAPSSFAAMAPTPALTQTRYFSAVQPHWRINAAGRPERLMAGGVWQPVLAGETAKMRVVSLLGGEVWVGGEKSRLYRSTDNGETWIAVTLPSKNGTDHTIVHIDFQSPETGTVTAEDGTAWRTVDGGWTWE